MRFALIQCVALCFMLAGCSGFFVGFVSNPGGMKSVSGTVSIVNLGFIQDPMGTKVTLTAVTFINSETTLTINFCGDQRSQFPLNRPVRVDFNNGFQCATLGVVVVIAWAEGMFDPAIVRDKHIATSSSQSTRPQRKATPRIRKHPTEIVQTYSWQGATYRITG